jgi:uncharacterized membrane protein
MRKIVLTSALLLIGLNAYCCTTCNQSLQKAIFNSTFYPNLVTMLSAFIVLGVLVIVLSIWFSRREKSRHHNHNNVKLTVVPLVTASVTLGIGIGGFIDGTVLHQILQWHEMLSNKLPPLTLINKSVNMFWDGIFHLFCLIVTLVGIILLFKILFRKDVIVTTKTFAGGLLLGWGIFNVIEGIIDHQILKLHNVREVAADNDIWNYGFLGISVLFIFIAIAMIKSGTPKHLYKTVDI